MVKEIIIDDEGSLPDDVKDSSPEPKEEKDNPKGVIKIILVLIGIFALFFIAGYLYVNYFYHPETKVQKVTYNNFDFFYYDDLWHFQWQSGNNEYNVHLRFNPKQAENVSVIQLTPFNNFTTDKVYVTFDPAGNLTSYTVLATGELSLSMKKVFGKNPIGSCARNVTEACAGVDIITCDNTNESVVFLKEAPETKVIIDDNCLTIQGQKLELLRAVDRVLYEWYGIMKPDY